MAKTTTIVEKTAAPLGWFSCYLAEYDANNQQARILVLPVALWVTVEYNEDAETMRQEIRHFVADRSGDIIDYREVDMPFLCIAPPGVDPEVEAKDALENEPEALEAILSQRKSEELCS